MKTVAIKTIIALLLCGLMFCCDQAAKKAEQRPPCEAYGNTELQYVPARCVAYFTTPR